MSDQVRPMPPAGLHEYGFRDAEHYIEDITYAIWNCPDRDPELIRRYYGADTQIHTDAGDTVGAAAVIANTEARLETFPDFHGTIAETLWTGGEESGYRTSMRWTWTGTNRGPSAFGPATGQRVRFSAIANCVIRGEVIVEEWLCSNTLSLTRQLGVTPPGPRDADTASYAQPSWSSPPVGEGLRIADHWKRIVEDGELGAVAHLYAEGVRQQRGTDRHADGRQEVTAWFACLREHAGALGWRVDDSYGATGDDGVDRVATQWTLHGTINDRPVQVTGISHHHLLDGLVTAEWTEYDQLALLHQCGLEL